MVERPEEICSAFRQGLYMRIVLLNVPYLHFKDIDKIKIRIKYYTMKRTKTAGNLK
jgi:hypothetical protein